MARKPSKKAAQATSTDAVVIQPTVTDAKPAASQFAAEADAAVSELVVAHSSAGIAEHKAIVRMFELLAIGVATPAEFAARYATLMSEKGLKDTSTASRKSNLKKILEFSVESSEFNQICFGEGRMGLQAMYALRCKMMKELASAVEVEVKGEVDDLSPIEVLLQQLANAQDAAANAGLDDVCESLRQIFLQVQEDSK